MSLSVRSPSRRAPVALALALAIPAAAEPPAPVFVERSREVGLDFVHFNGMSGELYFAEMAGGGAALFDYDGDGDTDLYCVQGHMLGPGKTLADATFQPSHPEPFTDRLYRNDTGLGSDGRPVLRFTDVTDRMGVLTPGYGMGVTSGDYDNDGWPDLYVTNMGSNQMLRNNGDGTFTDTTDVTGTDDRRWSVSAAFVDYDQDGWLDLFVANYVDFRLATHKPCASATGQFDYCGPLAYRPEPDRLFRNRGDGTFEDVTTRSRVHTEYGSGLGVVAADFNGDGRPDIYVANDQMPNQMWIKQGDGTFVNEALFAGSAVNEEGKPEASMGVVAGDFDGDGSEDLFMTHITRETNTLYLNDGTGLFVDSSRESGLGMASFKFTGFGTVLSDYDNDGWQDLFIANGAVKTIPELAQEGDKFPLRQTNQLFRNLGGGRFEEISDRAGEALQVSEVSRGVSAGDLDQDGDTDLVVANNMGPTELLDNQVGSARRWLGLRLVGGPGLRDMLGTRVAARLPGGQVLWRRANTDGSYASGVEPRVLVGLGDSAEIAELEVIWPDGRREVWRRPPVDRYLTVRQGGARRMP